MEKNKLNDLIKQARNDELDYENLTDEELAAVKERFREEDNIRSSRKEGRDNSPESMSPKEYSRRRYWNTKKKGLSSEELEKREEENRRFQQIDCKNRIIDIQKRKDSKGQASCTLGSDAAETTAENRGRNTELPKGILASKRMRKEGR